MTKTITDLNGVTVKLDATDGLQVDKITTENIVHKTLGAGTPGQVLSSTGTGWNWIDVSATASTTYSAGTGLELDGTTFNNTAPDQTVVLTQAGATTITGTYPNFTISSTDTNTTYSAGTGLELDGTTFNNTAPDQTVVLTQAGATTITGTYPNFTISSTDTNTTYSAGTNMSLVGTTFNIPQSVATTANPTFNSISFTLAGDATQYITRLNALGMTTNYLTVNIRFTNNSDDRIKSNEKLITNGISIIKQLKPKIYDKHTDHRVPAEKEDNDLSGIDYIKESGFVAQEVDTITELKHLVIYDNVKDLYSLNYIGMIPYLVNSIQELDELVKNQQTEITELKNALNILLSEAGKPTI